MLEARKRAELLEEVLNIQSGRNRNVIMLAPIIVQIQ